MRAEEEPQQQGREGWDPPDDLNVSLNSSLSRSDKFRRTIRRKSFNTHHLTTGSAVFTETREANFLDDDGPELEGQNSSLHSYFEELLFSVLDRGLQVSKQCFFLYRIRKLAFCVISRLFRIFWFFTI